MTSKEKFLLALKGKNTGRPPLWVMRQAGRYLPEYRELKKTYSFLDLIKTPELAKEVTMQPLRRFDLDAAILFSDILVIPEALGQKYFFREKGGIQMEFPLERIECVDKLDSKNIGEKLSYMKDALSLISTAIGDEKALLGFCGSPWTLACYMIQGGSEAGFPKAVHWAENNWNAFEKLMEKITESIIQLIDLQSNTGIDALQIFDSWHSLCPPEKVWDWSLRWIREITRNAPAELPIILYAKSSLDRLKMIKDCEVSGLSIDHSVSLSSIRENAPTPFILQGNLNPEVMETNPDIVTRETHAILSDIQNDPAYILNLGHGIRPKAKIECMDALIKANFSFYEDF